MAANSETPTTDPIQVCTLPPAGLRERLAWVRQEILPHVRRTERLESGVAWDLDAVPGLAEKLDRLIALERECCAGIAYTRAESSDPRSLRLEVHGVDPEAFLRTLHSQVPGRRTGLRRLAEGTCSERGR